MNNMAAPVIMDLTYSFECGVPGCGATIEENHALWRGAAIPWVKPPDGWRFVHGIAVCPNHRIEVLSGHALKLEAWIIEGEDQWSTEASLKRANAEVGP